MLCEVLSRKNSVFSIVHTRFQTSDSYSQSVCVSAPYFLFLAFDFLQQEQRGKVVNGFEINIYHASFFDTICIRGLVLTSVLSLVYKVKH